MNNFRDTHRPRGGSVKVLARTLNTCAATIIRDRRWQLRFRDENWCGEIGYRVSSQPRNVSTLFRGEALCRWVADNRRRIERDLKSGPLSPIRGTRKFTPLFDYADAVYRPRLDTLTTSRIQRSQNGCLRFSYRIRKYDHGFPSARQTRNGILYSWYFCSMAVEISSIKLCYTAIALRLWDYNIM